MPSELGSVLERAITAQSGKRRRILETLRDEAPRLNAAEADLANYAWQLWARDSQRAPSGDWAVWLVMAGRGFGKTRTGAEWVRARVESGASGRIALVARAPADARRRDDRGRLWHPQRMPARQPPKVRAVQTAADLAQRRVRAQPSPATSRISFAVRSSTPRGATSLQAGSTPARLGTI